MNNQMRLVRVLERLLFEDKGIENDIKRFLEAIEIVRESQGQSGYKHMVRFLMGHRRHITQEDCLAIDEPLITLLEDNPESIPADYKLRLPPGSIILRHVLIFVWRTKVKVKSDAESLLLAAE